MLCKKEVRDIITPVMDGFGLSEVHGDLASNTFRIDPQPFALGRIGTSYSVNISIQIPYHETTGEDDIDRLIFQRCTALPYRFLASGFEVTDISPVVDDVNGMAVITMKLTTII